VSGQPWQRGGRAAPPVAAGAAAYARDEEEYSEDPVARHEPGTPWETAAPGDESPASRGIAPTGRASSAGPGWDGGDTPGRDDRDTPRRSDGDTAAGTVRLTSRGAVLLMIAIFGAGLLAEGVTGWAVLAGAGFALGSAAAARYTKPADLLTVAVTPPLLFFVVLLFAKAMSATGNTLVSIAGGSALSLATLAPWLFAGTAINLVIGCARGLPRCVAELRRDSVPAPARQAGTRAGAPGAAWPER
jgi:Domain of unknown function (DUF6542)